MARTSKTVIGKGSGEQSDRMMRAAESGANIVARERDRADALRRENQQIYQRVGENVGNALSKRESMKQQQSQFEASKAQQQSQFEASQAQQSSQFNRQQAGQDARTDLEAAKAGFERGGARSAQLDQEMAKGGGEPFNGPMPPGQERPGALDPETQQRLQEQAQKPMEMDANGKWRPTAERTQQLQQENRLNAFKAETERMRALAYRDQVGASAQKALARGDMDAYKADVQRLVALPNGRQKQYDRLLKGEPNPNDFSQLKQMAEGISELDPSLEKDIDAGVMTPRIASFLRATIAKESLQSIVLSKGNTENLEIDWTNPQMVAFQEERNAINGFMRDAPGMDQLSFIKSTDDKMRFLNVMAASKLLTGTAMAGGAPVGSGGGTDFSNTVPPTGQMMQEEPAAPAPQMFDQTQPNPNAAAATQAVRDVRAGGGTPQEALQAGQDIDNTRLPRPTNPRLPGMGAYNAK